MKTTFKAFLIISLLTPVFSQWAKSIVGSRESTSRSIAVEKNGDYIYITGDFIETNDFDPGIGAMIRTLLPPIILDKSSDKVVNLLTLTPSAGSISNSVMIGPGEMRTTLPKTPKVSSA